MQVAPPPPHQSVFDALCALAGVRPVEAAERAGVPLRVIYSRSASPALLARVVRLSVLGG